MNQKAELRKTISILSEAKVNGSSIVKSVKDKAQVYSYFHDKPYFMELFMKHHHAVTKGKKVKIVCCSQKIVNKSLHVQTELNVSSLVEVREDIVVKIRLKIPAETYLVKNMICIPELLRQIYNGNNLKNVLKLNSCREGDLVWNL